MRTDTLHNNVARAVSSLVVCIQRSGIGALSRIGFPVSWFEVGACALPGAFPVVNGIR